jgi:hypothetical protein
LDLHTVRSYISVSHPELFECRGSGKYVELHDENQFINSHNIEDVVDQDDRIRSTKTQNNGSGYLEINFPEEWIRIRDYANAKLNPASELPLIGEKICQNC